ncbi:hypothetical protein ALC57_02178 [Trachymyrmex cornetzi]|uniref:Uncharacterized protein n=1 Tax=Trachymyrmex cornetzi TaxID=471704 RepID=A0A195EJY3_9HYME|nr:hypothetical protein ALC57_02178 [Trachymyrmex cornetzi]
METMEEGDGRLQNGSSAKMPNRLKLVLSDENDKVTSEKTAEMDPYRELELYLAKVKCPFSSFLICFYLIPPRLI